LGASALNQVYLLFDNNVSFSLSCTIRYDVQTRVLWLMNDAGNLWLGPLTLGSPATLQNSRCTISGMGADASPAGLGPNLGEPLYQTIYVPVTFQPLFNGTWGEWLYASDIYGENSGWQKLGTWTVAGPPSVVSVTPSSGSGASQTFHATYSSSAGASALNQLYLLFDNAVSFSLSCTIRYDAQANALWLMNDAGNAWQGPLTPGAAGTLANSRCTISGTGASATPSGNNLTLNVPVSFQPLFNGTWAEWLYASDNFGQNSGWQNSGMWTTP
jgi:hypothetical protein